MQGRLTTLDYTAAMSATSQTQRSTTTCTGICRQPTKPVKTSHPLTSVLHRLTTGASQFFGALLVEPLPPCPLSLLQLKNQRLLLKSERRTGLNRVNNRLQLTHKTLQIIKLGLRFAMVVAMLVGSSVGSWCFTLGALGCLVTKLARRRGICRKKWKRRQAP